MNLKTLIAAAVKAGRYSVDRFVRMMPSFGMDDVVKEFHSRHPDKCIICHFHDWAVRHGHEINNQPRKHKCKL
jgi:hypothetical protein